MGSASGTFKVIDPAGAKVYHYWEHIGSEEVGHLPQGTSVVVTGQVGRQVRIVEPRAGCVFLASLEQIASAPVASEASATAPAPTHRYETRQSVALSPAAAPTPAAPTPAPAPAVPPPDDDDAVMAEATETQGQANARRRDEITAQLDRLKLLDPNTYTTVVACFLGIARGAADDATRRGVAL